MEVGWKYGVPELHKLTLTDERGQEWTPGAFISSGDALQNSGEVRRDWGTLRSSPELTTNLTYYSNQIAFMGSLIRDKDQLVPNDINTVPLDHPTWTYVDYYYKSLLGACMDDCATGRTVGPDNCAYAYGVLKYLTYNMVMDRDHLDDDIKKLQDKKGQGGPGLYFKCYLVPDQKWWFELGWITPNCMIKQRRSIWPDLPCWEANWSYVTARDSDMLYSHVWEYQENPPEKGYCSDCIWKRGLPDQSFENFGDWKVGTLAQEKPVFYKQESTDHPVYTLVAPGRLAYEAMTLRPLTPHFYQWDYIWHTYTEGYLSLCHDKCEKDDDCAGAYGVVSYVDPAWMDPSYEWDDDVYELYASGIYKRPNVLIKCYGFPWSKAKGITDIEKIYINETQQYRIKTQKEPDLKILYSHYYTKSTTV